MKDKFAIGVLSASRPEYFFETIRHLKIDYDSGDSHLKVYVHEEILDAEKSRLVTDIINSNRFRKFTKVMTREPSGGGEGVRWLLENCNSEYMLMLEDDWVCLKPLPVKACIDVMDDNPKVNQITFNKRGTMAKRGAWKKERYVFNGLPFITNPHWTFNPSIWRVDWILERLPKKRINPPPVWTINKQLKEGMPNAEWVAENVGTFFWGDIRQPPIVKHIGHKSARLGIDYQRERR